MCRAVPICCRNAPAAQIGNQKYRSAIIVILERGLQLLGRNPRLFLRRRAEGEEELVFSGSFSDRQAIPLADPFPIQVIPASSGRQM
jgi:hypothetical protein